MQRLVRCEVEELSHKMEKRNETFERFMPKADRDDVVDNQLLTHRRPPSVSLSPPTTSVSFISLHSTERKVKEKKRLLLSWVTLVGRDKKNAYFSGNSIVKLQMV
jgi:hypothetical protein